MNTETTSLVFPVNQVEVSTFVDPETSVVWLHAGDIGKALEITTLSRYLPTRLEKSEYREIRFGTLGRPSLYVREEGVYILLMQSTSRFATTFQRWLAYEVLPSLRKNKRYEPKPEDRQHFAPLGLGMQLVAQAIELGKSTGLEPERILHLHRQASGEPDAIAAQIPAQMATQVKHRRLSKLASDEERLYQLRRVSAKFGGSATAREVAQFCKAAGSTIEVKKWLYDLVGKGLVSAEMVGRCQRFKVL